MISQNEFFCYTCIIIDGYRIQQEELHKIVEVVDFEVTASSII